MKVWELATEIMDLFEYARLKGQKLNLSTLLTKPEFKQQYLAPIRRLGEADQCQLLHKVIDGTCSLTDLKVQAAKIKQMTALRAAFVRLTNKETWEEAQEKYPMYATDVQLQKFLKVDLNKSIPLTFTDFCTRATLSEAQSSDVSTGCAVHFETYLGHVIHSKVTELNGHAIKNAYTDFKGANLSITRFDKVCCGYTSLNQLGSFTFLSLNIQDVSREVVESTSYTLKEINTDASCVTYTTAALCTPEVWSLVEEVWRRAYINTDLLFLQTPTSDVDQVCSCICILITYLYIFSATHVTFDESDSSKAIT